MVLEYNNKTENFEEKNTANSTSYFQTRKSESAYAKRQAQQVWSEIHKKVEWLPFKCYCIFGGISVLLSVVWFFMNGLSNILNLFFLGGLVFSLIGTVGGIIGFFLKQYVFRSKVLKYIESHPNNVCISRLKKMLDNLKN